jgi:TonB-linked SusC/RagA family outer membrane protein
MTQKREKILILREVSYSRHLKALLTSILLIFLYAHISVQAATLDSVELIKVKTYISEISVKGIVKDEYGNPLPGAGVTVKGTSNVTITDLGGNYTLNDVLDDDVLMFTYVGFENKEVYVNGKSEINVTLGEDTQALDEVVVVGYGTQIKEKLTGSVVSADLENLTQIPESNLSNLLAGRMSGVYVGKSTGVPGSSSSIRIRSQSSWNSSPPLFVIDGVIRDKSSFDRLDVNEIDDISVLKDAATAAIYGSRSSNGVILVTTKSGVAGKTSVNVSMNYSIDEPTSRPKYLSDHDSYLSNNIFWQKQAGVNWFGEDEIEMFKEKGYSFNYLDYLYQAPTTKNTSISASGGNENVKFYIGGTYFDDDAYLPNVNYSKYNLRAKVDTKITDNLFIGLNLNTNGGKSTRFNSGRTDLSDWYGRLETHFFYIPIEIDGNLVDPEWQMSIPGMIRDGGYQENESMGIDALIDVSYNVPFVDGLSTKITYSKNYVSDFGKNFNKKHKLYKYERTGSTGHFYTENLIGETYSAVPAREYLSNNFKKSDSYQFNAQVSYSRRFERHNLDAIAIYEEFDEGNVDFRLTRLDFPLIVKDQYFATSNNVEDSEGNGSESYNGRKSFLGRLNYEFDNKYIISGSFRADGSMLFAPDKRWGYFPSASVGWIISREPFFKNKFSQVSLLKLRASYGFTGNDAVGGWQWQEAYYGGGQYYLGNSNQNIIRYGGIVNSNLTWEKSRSLNIGIDILTKQNIGVNLDYWKRHSYDILGRRILNLPTTFGGTLPDENYGIMDSQGLEIGLSYNTNFGQLNFDAQANFSYATTKIIRADVAANVQDVDNPNGKPLGYTATYVSTGIIRSQEEIDALPEGYTIMGAPPTLGHLNYEDFSGPEGVPDNRIDGFDRQIISDFNQSTAPYSAGLNLNFRWKGITLNTFFQSLFGYQKLYTDHWGRGFPLDARVYSHWGDSWSAETPNATYPVISGPGEPPSAMASSFWYENGGFLRLKNLSVGYDLPIKWVSEVNMKKATIYINGTNVFYLSSFKWYDPEIGSQASYPNMRTLNLGINLTF